MKKIHKHIALMLSMVMLCTVVLPSVVYANGVDSENLEMLNKKTMTNTDTVYVDDGEGNIISVEIRETVYYGANTGIVPMAFSLTNKVGERRTYTVKVSNEAMGVQSLFGGNIEMTMISFMAMVLGIANGIKNLCDKNIG